ncbi:MAG: flippase-like domain-containing protein [Anaerolineae bacterium]|nr:flippase-like domain-containing protein [Anaerolineae bacterium]
MKRWKRWGTLLIGLLISAVALYLAFRNANPAEMVDAFSELRYQYVILSLVVVIISDVMRGMRWSILMQGRISMLDGFWLFNVGYLFNNVLPARLGEFARAILGGHRQDVTFTSALSSIVVERLFDLISVVILLCIGLVALPLPDWATTGGMTVGGGALVGVVVLALAARYSEPALKVGVWMLALLPGVSRERAHAFLSPFVEGLGAVSDLRSFAAGFGMSLACWAVSGLSAWLLMLAFWQDVPIPVAAFVLGTTGLGVAIPAAPASVGTFQAAVLAACTAAGYDLSTSQSFSIALHLSSFVPTCLLGFIGLLREGVSFGQVAQQAQELKEYAPIAD